MSSTFADAHGAAFERRPARPRRRIRAAITNALTLRAGIALAAAILVAFIALPLAGLVLHVTPAGFLAFVVASFALVPFLGRDFFPAVDAGAIALHVRAPMGTRIEETAAEFDHIEAAIRRIIPPDQLKTVIDNIGLPLSNTNLI